MDSTIQIQDRVFKYSDKLFNKYFVRTDIHYVILILFLATDEYSKNDRQLPIQSKVELIQLLLRPYITHLKSKKGKLNLKT